VTEVKTFPVPFALGEIKENITLITKKSSQYSEVDLIQKALKFHVEGNISEAIKCYQHCLKQGINDHRVYSNFGVILQNLGKLKEAEILTRKAIEINPNFADAYSNLGNILGDLGELQEAEISIRKAIAINPNFADAYSNLGNILQGLGRLQEAEILTRKAIEINPNFADAYSNLGNILRDLDKLQEAEIYTRKAVELNPDCAISQRELGICLYLLGDVDSALKFIVKANYLDPQELGSQILLSIFQKEKDSQNLDLKIHKKKISLDEKVLESNPMIINRPVESDLIDCLYKIKSRDQEKYQNPTFGDARGSDYKLFERSESMIKIIKEDLTKIAINSVKSDVFISESFFTIFRSGGGLVSHAHLNKLDKIKGINLAQKKFSLVYYLSVGDQNCDEPGILKLENPYQEILPSNGLIIIFPAGRKHSVLYQGKKDRIIIGVNFYRV